MSDIRETYIKRIRENIKNKYLDGDIIKRYSFKSFCNNFIPDEKPLEERETDKCLCGHDIVYNYRYTHKKRGDYFILGSCCIEKFSEHYKSQRICKGCGDKIKKNKTNYCKDCIDREKNKIKREKERLRYIIRCQCKDCGYQKKDDKYRYCYKCFQRRKENYC